MPHGNKRCEFCNMREIDGHRWNCPMSDEDAEDWMNDDDDDTDWWDDDEDDHGA